MLKSIEIQNYQSHVDSKLELSPGVNVILGETDSGKSAIIRSLVWATQNRPLGSSFVRSESKSCEVSVKTDTGTVIRSRRKGFNGYLIGEQEFREIGSTVPVELYSVLDLQDINLQLQLQPHFLLTLPPGQISKYISDVLGFEVADRMLSLAKSRAASINSELDRVRAEQAAVSAELERLASLDLIEEYMKEAEAVEVKLSTLTRSSDLLAGLVASMKSVEPALEASRAEVVKLSAAELSLSQILDESVPLCESWADLRKSETGVEGFVASLKAHSSFLDSVKPVLGELDSHLQSCSSWMENLDTLAATCQSVQASVDKLSALHSASTVDHSNLAILEEDIAKVRYEYAHVLLQIGVCPYCYSQVDASIVDKLATQV